MSQLASIIYGNQSDAMQPMMDSIYKKNECIISKYTAVKFYLSLMKSELYDSKTAAYGTHHDDCVYLSKATRLNLLDTLGKSISSAPSSPSVILSNNPYCRSSVSSPLNFKCRRTDFSTSITRNISTVKSKTIHNMYPGDGTSCVHLSTRCTQMHQFVCYSCTNLCAHAHRRLETNWRMTLNSLLFRILISSGEFSIKMAGIE